MQTLTTTVHAPSPFTNSSQTEPRRGPGFVRRALAWSATLVGVLLPVAGLVMAIILSCVWGFSWVNVGLMLGMYAVTMLGITAGFHRLFTHRSFQTIAPIRFVLGALGSMAFQGSLVTWVGLHRKHHKYSDSEGDPHSPHDDDGRAMGLLRGFWHAHIGWAFAPMPDDIARYAGDLNRSRAARVLDALFPLWALVGLLIPSAIGFACLGWRGAISGLLWGGLARVFLAHHVTWCVNSVCHLWGSRPYASGDESRNNALVGVLALGEGWHNNHHAFPSSARHGLRWWQLDLSYWFIRTLVACRLAWGVRLPTAHELAVRGEQPAPLPV